MKCGLSKEALVVSDKGEVKMGQTTFMTSKASLTKEVVFHKGGLSEEALLYSSVCACGLQQT